MTSLFRHPDFRRLWIGDTISQAGTQLSLIAVPVIAVQTLNADERSMGLLAACENMAFLVVGLPAGAWVDRWRKRRVLIANDLLRAAAFTTVPIAWALGGLTIWQLYVVSLIVSVGTVFFDVAYQSYLPALVDGERLVEGNAKLEASRAVAQVGGPAAGGALLRVLAGPLLIAADAVSFLVSAVMVGRIGLADPPRTTGTRRPLRTEIAEGLVFVVRHPLLVRITACTSISNFASGITGAMLVLYVLRELGLRTDAAGLVFASWAAGGFIGAVTADRLARRVGEGRIIPVAQVVSAVAGILLPLAAPLAPYVHPLVPLVVGGIVTGVGIVVYNITQVSFRQRLCPPELLGRMNASIRFLVWGTLPLGSLAGGALGAAFGVATALWVAVFATFLAGVPVVWSPLLGMRSLPRTLDATADRDADRESAPEGP